MSEPKYRKLGWRGRLSADDDRGYSPAPAPAVPGGRDSREEVDAVNLPPAFSPAKPPVDDKPEVPAGYEVSAQPGAGVGLRNVRGGFAPDVAGAPGGVPGGGKGESTMPMGGKAWKGPAVVREGFSPDVAGAPGSVEQREVSRRNEATGRPDDIKVAPTTEPVVAAKRGSDAPGEFAQAIIDRVSQNAQKLDGGQSAAPGQSTDAPGQQPDDIGRQAAERGKAEQERAKAEREKAERERTAKEREEVARAYDVPITSLQQLMDRIKLESDDDRKKREKREKSRRIISAVSDGLSALGNLYFTSQYAPDMYDHEKESRLKSTNSRIEKLREERDKERDRWLDYAMRIGQWQTARDRELRNFDDTKFKQRILANQEERAGKEYGWKERIYGEKQKQEANRTKKSEEDAKKAKSDAETAGVRAKYAEDNEKSKINKNNTAAGANRARANASNASADASRARAAKTRSGGGGRGRGGGKKSDLDIVETTVTTSSKKNGVTTRTTTKTKSRTGQMKPGFAKGLKFKK